MEVQGSGYTREKIHFCAQTFFVFFRIFLQFEIYPHDKRTIARKDISVDVWMCKHLERNQIVSSKFHQVYELRDILTLSLILSLGKNFLSFNWI